MRHSIGSPISWRDDRLGLLDRFRKHKSLPEILEERWKSESDGSISDMRRRGQKIWIVGPRWVNTLFSYLEMKTSLSLGRKIAHASSESEEFLVSLQEDPPRGRNPRKWKNFSKGRLCRGLGEIEIIEDSLEKTIILVNKFSSGPLDAGIIASTWEIATGKRHKFRWSESKNVLMVELTRDEVDIPSPKEMKKNWDAIDEITENSSIVQWDDIRELESGGWEIDGERKIIIHRDLILRFEEFTHSQITSISGSREEDYTWEDVVGNRALWWTAVADSCRQLFLESEKHVMISDAKDWKNSSIRNLSIQGLGRLSNPKLNLENGELNSEIVGCFHPAISGGILLGCWERSTGVKGRIKIGSGGGVVTVNIAPKRASIAFSK